VVAIGTKITETEMRAMYRYMTSLEAKPTGT